MFANCKYEELSYPKTQKECDPNPITSIENATTSSSTSLLASNKEIPPPPGEVAQLQRLQHSRRVLVGVAIETRYSS